MSRRARKLPSEVKLQMPDQLATPPLNLDDRCKIKLADDSEEIEVRATDLMMQHKQSGTVMAVKRIKSSINDQSQKQMLTELDACKRSDCCPQMVRFFGAMFREGDVWICMEVMDTSLDKFYRKSYQVGRRIPEMFIAKMTLDVVEGLNFMKEKMNLIHRDVKPSNILLNLQGQAKICDFGISGHLTNSFAKTVQVGCKPYMPPERIDGETKSAYDVRADVWSLGITIIEVATGTHPYSAWKTPFEQLKQVVYFVKRCLEKDYNERPKYPELLGMPFLESARKDETFCMAKFIFEVSMSREAIIQFRSAKIKREINVGLRHNSSCLAPLQAIVDLSIPDALFTCRWCLETKSCVPSKYLCHPSKTVLHYVNCPAVSKFIDKYNDTEQRSEIIYYIQAVNRVSPKAPPEGVDSCLSKLNYNISVLYKFEVKLKFDGKATAVLILVNHSLRKIFIAFRSSNYFAQFMMQFVNAGLGMMDDFHLGGKVVSYYGRAYRDLLDYGIDNMFNATFQKYPHYSVVLTGHSMGGALASLFSFHIAKFYAIKNLAVYPWSSPRFGDEDYVIAHQKLVKNIFRIIRRGDMIADQPFRISQTIPMPHHTFNEVLYESDFETFQICDQPETEYCSKGNWPKIPWAHFQLFGQTFRYGATPGICE
ncbi:unnamed protein product [Caenorhabditis auriculariae]|uniref:mitogen-activated protein kinase kinase n=1 Tax=Caenorhabditis auriculariae TaxID=2777116 RepID=A0A8S1HGH9_9PELO|nr:unnamed protein product [Caenorhabditis auriculariae]